MAKTVAEIDGDSSGLVSELGKAKTAMGDLGGQGKKLTDQLKEIADEADVAAGNLVDKLGGPGAIKAIAGVGLAFEGASRLASAFLDSSEALFRSYGDEGQKVWDQTEKSMFAIKGAFAEAVLGGGELEDMGARLTTIFELTKVAVDLLLSPLSLLSNALKLLVTEYSEATIEAAALTKAERAYADAMNSTNTAITAAQTGYNGIQRTLIALLGTKKDLAVFDLQQTQNQILSQVQLAENADFQRRLAAGNLAADQAEAAERRKMGESYVVAFRAMAEKRIEEARNAARNETLARIDEEEKGKNEQLKKMREGLQKLEDEKQAILTGKKSVEPTGTGGGGGGKEKTPEEIRKENLDKLSLAAGTPSREGGFG